MGDEDGKGEEPAEHTERPNLCLPDFEKEMIAHQGDVGFKPALKQYYESGESNAAERLIEVKNRLRGANTHDFWGILMEEMCDIVNAQCGFVAKRVLVDDDNSAVEMPALGEPGSCLLGVAFYLNNGRDVKNMYRDYRYHAYGSPCAHMKHDKVLVIPERLAEFVPNNPNKLPWEKSEAFIGVPLFSEGKSFAHFGMIWSSEGAPKRQLSWSFIEVLMHSLEDMITQRLVEGRGFAREPDESKPARIIPLDAITASQSLKPYARSLSHELRTPMQGVIGMLEIMHSTVIDAMETQQSEAARTVFEELKSNIEMVQDSSKRAVEAADNVVHAYDLNMQMPDTPLTNDDDSPEEEAAATLVDESQRPNIVVEGAGISMSQSKEKRPRSEERDFHPGPPLKRLAAVTKKGLRQEFGGGSETSHATASIEEEPLVSSRDFATFADSQMPVNDDFGSAPTALQADGSPFSPLISTLLNPGHRHITTREFMHSLINEAIRSVHPVRKVNSVTELGEIIEFQTEGPRGEKSSVTVTLMVELDVPETIIAEEQHLHFVLQKVVDNAIKFTENGSIVISVKLARNAQLIEFRIIDTGCGITEESKGYLFKPHFQEDATISRSRDGLGLSLFNAKAHIRKNLGGDMTLERSATAGPLKGSEFLIRLPLSALPDASKPNTPLLGYAVPGPTPRGSRHSSPRPSASSRGSSNISAPTSAPTSIPSSEPTPRRSSIPPRRESSPRRRSSLSARKESIPRTSSIPAQREDPTPGMPVGSEKTNPTATQKKQNFNRNLAQEIPLTFLVAEDNVINRNVLVGYLKKLGYSSEDIILAFDGAEAVQQYQASLSRPPGKRIDAVLMDLWMPNMDGYQATEHILNLAKRRGETLAVMAVTADITSESLDRAKQTGMKGFMSKPYKVLDVQHLILEHFRSDLQAV